MLESVPAIGKIRLALREQWEKLKGFTPTKPKDDFVEDVNLDDERLIGIDSQIEELRRLVQYITNPEIYDRSNCGLEKGILLTGPSGNGKTYIARALCGQLNKYSKGGARYRFKELKWGEVRWSSEGIKTVIEQAKKEAPCVLFIDEIHNLPLQTKEGGETLTEFLTGMSGVNSENDVKHQIILLAATNQPEKLDSALLRPGRFGTIINFEKPLYDQRKIYFEIMLKLNAIDNKHIDIDSLARQTQGWSYSELESIVKGARFIARTLAKGVAQEHFQQKINKHLRLRDVVPPTETEKQYIAAHTAGHALMYVLLNSQEKLEFATIKGRWPKVKEIDMFNGLKEPNQQRQQYQSKKTKYGHVFTYSNTEIMKIDTKEEKEKQCKIKLAGSLAQKLLLGASSYSYRPKDKQKALNEIKSILLDGLLENNLSNAAQNELNQQASELLKKQRTGYT